MASEETIFKEFGDSLRKARIQQSRSLDDIASYTKIHRRHLEAIEAGDMSALPQGPYVKAFLREYARAVGLKVPDVFSTPTVGPTTTPKDPRVVSRAITAKADEVLPIAAVAKETARLANTAVNTAVKTVTKTTESVVKLVETGSKEALEVLTSKSLWEEAEEVRRERLGIPPEPKKQELTVRPAPRTAPDIEPAANSSEDSERSVPVKRSGGTAVIRPLGERTSSKAAPPLQSGTLSDDNSGSESNALAAAAGTGSTEERVAARSASSASGAETKRVSSKGATNVVIALLVLLFGGAAFYALRTYRSESGTTVANKDYIPAPLDKPQGMAAPKPRAPQPTETVTAPPAAVPSKDSLRFILKASQPVWVSIAPDGLPAYKGEMKAGEVRSFKAADRIIVNLGNQKAVQMTFDGQTLSNLPTIQNSGVVVRNLVLTRDKVSLGGQAVPLSSTVPTTSVPLVPSGAGNGAAQPSANTVSPNAGSAVKPSAANANSPAKTPRNTASHATTSTHSMTSLKAANGAAKTSSHSASGTPSGTTKSSKTSKPSTKSSKTNRKNNSGEIHQVEPIPARP